MYVSFCKIVDLCAYRSSIRSSGAALVAETRSSDGNGSANRHQF